jgi:hypothetical protein
MAQNLDDALNIYRKHVCNAFGDAEAQRRAGEILQTDLRGLADEIDQWPVCEGDS